MNAVVLPPDSQPLVTEAFLQDPYPQYEALRAAGPLHWSDEFFGGAWLLVNHDDVERVLRDPLFSAQRTGGWVMDTLKDAPAGTPEEAEVRRELGLFQRLFARAMLFMDAPDHTRLRQLLLPAFRPAAMAALQGDVEQWVDALIGRIEQGAPTFDFMTAFARPLPAQVICRMMGIAAPDQADFIGWSDTLAAFIGAPTPTLEQARAAHAAAQSMSAYFETVLPGKRRAPGDDLLSLLAVGEAQGQVQGGAELLAQSAMLLFAGHETTRNLLGNAVQTLLAHPGQWAALADDPALIPGAVREVLRFECPVQYTGRRVVSDTLLHGRQLRRGQLVVGLIGAANRDPSRYAQAQRFDITRKAGSSLAFGHGVHLCIGAALTLLEGEAALRALTRRWPALQLATPAAPAQWEPNPVYRGLARLPLTRP